ncbi:aspartate/glutamate racemase family protein [Thiohalocapsa marina]|uniref:aspartate/glutamate racemase family protein n=1 Tax=Thiohalocapsa marina TaxID=424902 RepID=UPI001FE77275|nr:aspartate/glutamate racemase family protein [Thiohalocapsa marina]
MIDRLPRFHLVLFWLLLSLLVVGPVGASDTTATSAASALPATAPADSPVRRQSKVIGIIGGIAWPSTLEYYRIMNERVRDLLGPPNSAEVLLYSISFGDFAKEERQAAEGDWEALTQTMVQGGRRLSNGGADFIIIASNTMNSTAEIVAREAGIPVLHIADAVGQAIQKAGLKKVALLGTKFTMEAPFYRTLLAENYGIEVVVPQESERNDINAVIFDELVNNRLLPQSKARYLAIIDRMTREDGIEGVILGCTEIPLLIKASDVAIPTFDSTTIHVHAAVEHALSPADGERATDQAGAAE